MFIKKAHFCAVKSRMKLQMLRAVTATTLMLLPVMATANTVINGGIVYEYFTEESEAEALSYDGETSDVVLPVSINVGGATYTVKYFELDFTNKKTLQSVTVTDGAQPGTLKFSGCSNLKSVALGSGINYIGDGMFYDCPELDPTSVLTDYITFVGEYAFGLSEPRVYALFDNMKLMGQNMLYNRQYTTVLLNELDVNWVERALEQLDLSATKNLSVTGYYDNYLNMPALESLTLKDIETLYITSEVAEITLLGKIGTFSYEGSALKSLNLVDAVSIGEFMLSGDCGLTSLDLGGKCNGSFYLSYNNTITTVTGCENVKDAQINNCSKITTLSFPDIEYFGRDAFERNKALKEVYFGDKLKEIHSDGVFRKCTAFEDLIYGGTIEQWLQIKFSPDESSPEEAMLASVPNFWYGHGNTKHTKLTELNSSNVGNAEAICVGAFTGYNGLLKVSLPSTVKTIGASAFARCKNLTEVDINPERIEQFAFWLDSSIADMKLGNNLKYIGPAFPSSFTNLTLDFIGTPDEWNKIERTNIFYDDPLNQQPDALWGYAMYGMSSIACRNLLFNGMALETIVLDEPEVISNAFKGCSSLKMLSILCGPMAPKIGYQAFYNCYNLKKITYTAKSRSNNLENGFEVRGQAFLNCGSLDEIEILDNLKSIGPNALYGTAWIKKQPQQEAVYLDTELGRTLYTYVGNAPENTRIEIPEGTEAINDGAFQSLSSSDRYDYAGITSVSIPSTVKYIGLDAFDGTSLNGNLTIPAAVTYMGGSHLPQSEMEEFVIADSPEPLEVQNQFYFKSVSSVYFGRNMNGGMALQSSEEVPTVTFGTQVTEVGTGMSVGVNVKSINALAEVPPVVVSEKRVYWGAEYEVYPAFSNIDYETCVLNVPKGSVEAYRSAPVWENFKTIKETEISAIDAVALDKALDEECRHYDIYGRTIEPQAPGLHIVVRPDGSSYKIYVRD